MHKSTSHSEKVVNEFVGNYGRTKDNRSENVELARLSRDIVWSYVQNGRFPPYLSSVINEAFGGASLDEKDEILKNIPDEMPENLKRYQGNYEAYRLATKSLSEKCPHYIRYFLKIYVSDDGKSLKFNFCYRTRDRSERNLENYSVIRGMIVRRQGKLYFLAGEPERDNLIYIVCPYQPAHATSDQIQGLIVTQNRLELMIAARIAIIRTEKKEESIISEIGVKPIMNIGIELEKILDRVKNRSDETYVLTWDD